MGKARDLTGMVFGRLTVLSRADDYVSPSGRKCRRWLCKCECGNEVVVMGTHLRCGDTKSCGCYQKEVVSENRRLCVDDFIGRVFGRLTVVGNGESYIPSNGCPQVRLHVLCSCGNERDVRPFDLLSGRVKSCGCYQKEDISNRSLVDLTGKVFGLLTVLKRADDHVSKSGRKSVRWLCKCECGNEVIVSASSLCRGNTKSCGCYKKIISTNNGQSNLIDLTGCRFGRLSVIGRADDYVSISGNRSPKWHCICDCGNEIDVVGSSLRLNRTHSCGCIISILERFVIQYFNELQFVMQLDYDVQKRYDGLVGIGGGKLSYDFVVYRCQRPYCFIECQGEQHYMPISRFGGIERFETQQEHDRRKREYAEQLGVPLIEIPYTADTYEKVVAILQEHGI